MHTQHSPYGALNTYEILGAEAAGLYTLEDRIGIGTFADVYQAKHEVTRETVAIKVLRAPYSRDTLARFKKEIRILAQIQHLHVVRLIEDHSSEEVPFCVMEYCNEDSLMALMNQNQGGLSLAMVDFFFPKIVQGVEALHQQGIIHRDLKPSNILLTKTEKGFLPKISDLGIAKKISTDLTQKRDLTQIDGGRTLDGSSLGTFGYLAPELLGYANEADQRTDIFSLGAILYEMIACANPFDAPDRSTRALEDNNAACRYTLSSHIPQRYHSIIQRCLERNPLERFPSCAELLQAFYAPPALPAEYRMGYLQTALLGGFTGLFFSGLMMWMLFSTISPPQSSAPTNQKKAKPSSPASNINSPIQLEPLPSRPTPTQLAQPPSRAQQAAPSRIYRRRRRRYGKKRPAPQRMQLPIFQVQSKKTVSKTTPDPYLENSSVAKDAKDAFGQKPKADTVFQDSEGLKKDTEDAFSQAKRRVPTPRPRSRPRSR